MINLVKKSEKKTISFIQINCKLSQLIKIFKNFKNIFFQIKKIKSILIK